MSMSPVWHPFTQHALEPIPPRIVRAEGASLFDQSGKRILDAISSWWVTLHGHCHPSIVDAIQTAATQLDQIIFAGCTHEWAETLARDLLTFAPPGLSHVFYSDSGSTSVEVAVKMALGWGRDQGRATLAVLEHGYHGDTVGGMSLGERGVFNAACEPLLFAVETVPFPSPGKEQIAIDRFENLARTKKLAGFLFEPLVLGAGGMKMYPPSVLQAWREIADATGTLLLADEVMTGWGRTGTRFACDQAEVTPDILCTSKGLTGGSLPLAATLCKPAIFAAHWSTDRARTLFHSSSYTANPIACAAAVACASLWKDGSAGDAMTVLVANQTDASARFQSDKRFSLRQCGTIVALDRHVQDEGYLSAIGPQLRAFALERGVLLRPLGNTIYVMPPFCTTRDELNTIYDVIDAFP